MYTTLILAVLLALAVGFMAWLYLLKKKAVGRARELENELRWSRRAGKMAEQSAKPLDGAPNPFLRVHSDGTIIYHNKESLPLLKAWGSPKVLPPSNPLYEYVLDALDAGVPQRREVKCGKLSFAMHLRPIVSENHVDVHGLDISDRSQAEQMLRKRAEQFQAIAGYSYDLESWHGPNARLVWVNPAVERLTGHSVQECMAMINYPLPLIHEDDLEDVAGIIGGFVEDKTSGNDLPFRIQHKDGSVLWGSMSWQPIYDAKGTYSGIRSSIRDITERKKKEEQILRQSAVLNAINDVFQEALTRESVAEVAETCLSVAEKLTVSKFGFIGEVNEAGLFDTIAISNPGWDACTMPDSDATRLIKDMAIRGIWSGPIKDGQSRIVNEPASDPDRVGVPEGHPPITCFLGVPLKQAGKTIGMIGLANKESGYERADQEAIDSLSIAFVEALQRKRMEEDLRSKQEDEALILRSVPMVLYSTEACGEFAITWTSGDVEKITGIEAYQFIEDPHIWSSRVHPEDRDQTIETFRQIPETGSCSMEYRWQHGDGSWLWFLDQAVLVRDSKGKPKEIIGTWVDITQRKQTEEQILRQSAVLNAINEVLQEALTCESVAEVAESCLSVAEKLTDSKFGFIGQVNEAGLFDTIAISNPGWDACKMPDSEATRLIKDMAVRGIWSGPIKDGQSRIVNEPASDPDRVGVPEGHPPITCFLGVPLKQAGRTIGTIGLANKESGYERADQEAIESLSIAFVEALQRKRAEKKKQAD